MLQFSTDAQPRFAVNWNGPRLHIDFETRSACDLKEAGLFVYAKHPTTRILCLAWAFDDEEPKVMRDLDPGVVAELAEHIVGGGVVVAHNVDFEFQIWNELIA